MLTSHEVQQTLTLLSASNPVFELMGKLLYGTGMRIMEVARLRIKDIDFEHGAIIVREGKGSHFGATICMYKLFAGLLWQHFATQV